MSSSAARKPTAAERIGRKSPAAQTELKAVSASAPRLSPYKLTVNLDPSVYDGLRDFAHSHRVSHQAVLESLVQVLLSDPSVATEVRISAVAIDEQRRREKHAKTSSKTASS